MFGGAAVSSVIVVGALLAAGPGELTFSTALGLAGILGGTDADLGLAERAFFYIPLQHSEDRLVQDLSVRIHDERLVAVFPDQREIAEGFAKYARLHRDIIERFGRYPHRNAVLGRDSTPEELEHLETGPRFGQ